MSSLSAYLESKNIKPESLRRVSERLEARTDADRALASARAARKAEKDKKEAGPPIAKPKSGRGVTEKQLATALAGKPVTRRTRSKMLRAATALAEKAKEPAPTMKGLFGDEKALVGESKGPKKGEKKKFSTT
jgi:hypothetical protein